MKGFEAISKANAIQKTSIENLDVEGSNPVSRREESGVFFKADRPQESEIVTYFENVKKMPESLNTILQNAGALALEITNIEADGVSTKEELDRVLPQVRTILPKLNVNIDRVGDEGRAAIEEFLMRFNEFISKNER